jgi:von Willebrand factor type A domain
VDVRFLTPWAALLAVTALVPIAVYALRRRRLRALERSLGLVPPGLRAQLPLVVALAAVPGLLGVAAAQPVVETTRTAPARTDAEAFVVLDVSRSMLAGAGPGEPTRFERAREMARQLRAAFPEVPFGIVTLTDRVLPHLFPTTDERVFAATLERALGVEKPPPGAFYLTFATNLNTLRDIPGKGYFRPSARQRVVVTLTDGETQAIGGEVGAAYGRAPRTDLLLVHVWDAREDIYETGAAEGYEPNPQSEAALTRLASLVEGRVLAEHDVSGLLDAFESAVGTGRTLARAERSGSIALMPWVTLAALLPLAAVLLQRNVWWSLPRRRRRAAEEPRGAETIRPRTAPLAAAAASLFKVK